MDFKVGGFAVGDALAERLRRSFSRERHRWRDGDEDVLCWEQEDLESSSHEGALGERGIRLCHRE